jgi:predicted ATPase
MGGLTLLLLGDVDACRAVTDELYPIAERNKFPWPLTYAEFQRGWLASKAGDRDAGIEQMLKAADGAPAAVLHPIVLTLIAEQQMLAGRFQAAMGTLDRAMGELKGQSNRIYEAESNRMRGEVLLAQSDDNTAEAEAAFRHALAVAAGQSNRPLELRAALSLARLLRSHARQAEARDLLAPIYGAFTEGFEEPDLQAAKALLAELHS